MKAIPAFTMAFASSSSAATLPLSISCAVASGEVTEGIARCCLPFGAAGEIQFSLVFSFVLQISLDVISQHHEHST
jgi:Na+/H+-dicarboxylate symporter